MNNREVAEKLEIKVRTVENHIGNISKKLHLKGKNQVVAWAKDMMERVDTVDVV